MSFSRKERMSGMAWRICASRSDAEPEGKARPDVGVDPHGGEHGGIDHAQPPSSIQPVCEQVRHLRPGRTVQVISYSAEGSVKGK